MAKISGGQKLERALADMARGLQRGAAVRVGFLERAKYPNGTPVALVAAVQNFGSPARGIPPRPFFSNMVAAKSKGWGPAVAANLKATNYDAAKALDRVGVGIAGQLRQSIIDTNAPPLARSTLMKRGVDPSTVYDPKNPKTFGAKPLVDTGHMLGSVDHEVKR